MSLRRPMLNFIQNNHGPLLHLATLGVNRISTEQSSLPVRQTLLRLGIRKSTFYNWLKRYQLNGVDGLDDRKPCPGSVWNKLPAPNQAAIIKLAWENQNYRHGNWL